MDARHDLLRFSLMLAGACVGAAALSYLVCATLLEKFLNQH